jgi:putative membrane protein
VDAHDRDTGSSPGNEPDTDYRFSLANERTFLSWIRTSIALLAGGVAVARFAPDASDGRVASAILAGLCIVLGGVLAVGAFLHQRRVHGAMAAGRPLPRSLLVPLVTGGITAAALLCALLIAFR